MQGTHNICYREGTIVYLYEDIHFISYFECKYQLNEIRSSPEDTAYCMTMTMAHKLLLLEDKQILFLFSFYRELISMQ